MTYARMILTSKEVAHMIRGSQPNNTNASYDYLKKKGLGHYIGGFVDEWKWESESDQCWDTSVFFLLEVYRKHCKHANKSLFNSLYQYSCMTNDINVLIEK